MPWRFGLAVLLVAAVGCSTVTLNPAGTKRRSSEPTLVQRKSFYAFGLVGDQSIDVRMACGSQQPVQIQARTTGTDFVVSILTLGIYTPRSVRIWCE